MNILTPFKTAGLSIIVAVFAVIFIAPQVGALKTADTMSASDKALSYSYYMSIQSCINKSNLDNDIDFSRVGTPSEWINGTSSNSRINTGYIINDGKDTNGEAYCKDIIGGALNFWGIDGKTFLTKLGYTLKSDGTQMNNHSNDKTTKFNSWITSEVYQGSTPTMTPTVEYALRSAALTEPSTCGAVKVGLYDDQDPALRLQADNNKNKYMRISSPTNDGGVEVYIYQRTGNESIANSFKPGGDRGGGVSCDSLVAGMNSLAKGIGRTTADDLYNAYAKALKSGLAGVIGNDCSPVNYSNQSQRNDCRASWNNAFDACWATAKISIMGIGQDKANGGMTPLYRQPQGKELDTLSVCIAKKVDGDNNAIAAAIKGTTAPVADTGSVVGDSATGDKTAKTTCAIDGIGWIICPVLTTAAKMVDSIYGWLVTYVEVPAINSNTADGTNTIYIAWSAARNIANIAFVIGFMIIIYSQLTSAGISNYGIKKLLPRIIIAAILVNISFWITAAAVDVSNIAGTSIYNILKDLPLGTVTISSNGWENAVGTLLAGATLTAGVVGTAAVIAAPVAAGVAGAALWTIIPIILTVILGLVVTFAILAGRQALIIILIILAPLAFVALLLPNTEKFFTLWRKSLTTMLIFYPLFALLFAGANIAALVILGSHGGAVTNSGDTSSAGGMIVVIALAVQVAPLWLVPFIVKFSGGIIGKMAGMINNKSKGLIDRSSKIGARKRGLVAHETLGHANNAKNPFGRMYRRSVNSNLRDKDRQSAIDAENGAGYNREQGLYDRINNSKSTTQVYDAGQESARVNSAAGRALNVQLGEANLQKTIDTALAAQDLDANADINLRIKGRVAQTHIDAIKSQEDQLLKDMTIKNPDPSAPVNPDLHRVDRQLVDEMQKYTRAKTVADSATQMAQSVQNQEYAADIKSSDRLASMAGGVNPHGADRVRAMAIATTDAATGEAIKNTVALLQNASSPSTMIDDAKRSFEEANRDGDKIKARAATQILNSTGSKGVEVLGKVIQDIETTNGSLNSVIVEDVKYDISAAGMKSKDSALDNWAISKSKEKLATISSSNSTVTRLNQSELASQGGARIDEWRRNGALDTAQAQSVLDAFDKGTIHLDPAKHETFMRAASGDRA